jgi:transposase
VESIRVLRVARSSARKDRVRALNQLRSLISTAPEELRSELRGLSIFRLVNKAAGLRPNDRTDVVNATKLALRSLARRVRAIDAEMAEIDAVLRPLVAATAPDLITLNGVGPDTAGALVVAAGDNPDRLRNEATFAHLCGVSPLDASSGKQLRHRLNRGGDRQANAALWRIVMTRMSSDPKTQHYIERRSKEGLTKTEAMRCLKRYVAREVFYYLVPLQAA